MVASTYKAQDVVDYVLRQLGDESSVQFTESDVIRWINAAQRDIIHSNKELNQVEATVNLLAGQRRYPVLSSLPDIMRIHSIEMNGRLLPHHTLEEVQDGDIPVSHYWYQFGGVLYIAPAPDVDVNEGLILRYTRAPNRITDTTEMLGIPDSYYKALIDYCMKEAYEQDENFEASQMKSSQFNQFIETHRYSTTVETGRDYPTIREVEY